MYIFLINQDLLRIIKKAIHHTKTIIMS